MSSDTSQTTPLGDDAELIAIAREYEAQCQALSDPPPLGEWLDRVAPGQRGVLLRRLVAVAADRLTERGVPSAVEALVAANPGLEGELRGLLGSRDAPTTGHDDGSSGGLLRVRCPHCRNPIEVIADADLDSVSCPSCGSDFGLASDTPTRVAEPARSVAHFDLIERVGAGAFGEVWKAHDTKLDRTVAVKTPRRGMLDRLQEKLFLREAQSAAQLSHPRIVPVHEVGRDGDTLYIVSDFVRGLTLADWLSGQTPTAREAAEYARQIAEALDHAHERGVVHRDLKPGNVMLDDNGECRLMDFGLARRDAGAITMTRDGQVLGTPAYMSPEQARGDAHAADRRSDVYSLGVILFELLTGERPFRGNERMLLHQVIHDEPPSPRKLNAAVPRDLETITLKCLDKDPDRRYATAGKVEAELARWLGGHAIEARPIPATLRAVRWCRRNPWPAALGLTVFTAVSAASVIATTAYTMVAEREHATQQALHKAEGERLRANDALIAASESQTNAHRAQYRAAMIALPRAVSQNRYGLARQLLSACRVEDRSWEWRYWAAQCDRSAQVYEEGAPVMAVAYSPDGTLIAAGLHGGTVVLHEVGRDESYRLEPIGNRATSLAFDPANPDRLLVGYRKYSPDEPGAVLWDLEHRRPEAEFPSDEGGVRAVGFSDHSMMALGHYDGTVQVLDAVSREITATIDDSLIPVKALAFSADEKRLAVTRYQDIGPTLLSIYEKPWSKGSVSIQGDRAVQSLAYLPRSPRLFTGGRGGDVCLLDTSLPRERWRDAWVKRYIEPPSGSKNDAWGLAVSPNGRSLAVASRNSAILLFPVPFAAPAWPSMPPRLFEGHEGFVNAVAFSPDGESLCSGSVDETLCVWPVGASSPPEPELTGFYAKNQPGQWPHCRKVIVRPPDRIWVASTESLDILGYDTTSETLVDRIGPFNGDYRRIAEIHGDRVVAATSAGVYTAGFEGGSPRLVQGTEDRGYMDVAAPLSEPWYACATGLAIEIRRCDDGKNIETINCDTRVRRLAVSPDGRWIAAAMTGNRVAVWGRGQYEKPARTWTIPTIVYKLAFSDAGDRLLVASGPRPTIFSLRDGVADRRLGAHNGVVMAACFIDGDKRIATATLEGWVHIWDTSDGAEVFSTRSLDHCYDVKAFDSDRLVVAGRLDGAGAAAAWVTHVEFNGIEAFERHERARQRNIDDQILHDAETSGAAINWRSLNRSHAGKTLLVQGRVLTVKDIGSRWFINFGEPGKEFCLTTSNDDFDAFQLHPREAYRGKMIRVEGAVSEFQGKLQINLRSPEQVQILE